MYPKKIDRSKAFFIFLLIFISIGLTAQKIDSLKKILPSSEGVNKYEILFGLAYEYSDVNDSLSLIYSDQAINIAFQLGDSTRIIKAGRIKAGELRRIEKIEESIQMTHYVMKIAIRHSDRHEIKLLLNSLAVAYTFKAEYDKALKCHFESLVIREAEGNKRETSITLNNIGVIYYKLRDFSKALAYYKRSLKLKRETDDKYDLDRLLINIGLCFNEIGEYADARKYINEGLEVCNGKCSDQTVLESQIGLGFSFFKTHDYSESLIHFKLSYEVAKRIGNFRFQAENLLSFAKIDLINKDYKEALKNLKEAETISLQKGYGQLLIGTYELFSKLYQAAKDFENIAFYQAKYIAIKDSIFGERLIKNLAQVQTAFEERENIKTIAERNQVVALQEEIIMRQQRQYIFIIVITCLIVSLALMLVYFNRQLRKINHELVLAKSKIQEQNDRLEHYNRELEERVRERTKDLLLATKALLTANKDLDNFIYKSSHDLRGPLATLKGLSNLALMDVKDEQATSYLKQLDATAERLNRVLSRLSIVNYINDFVLLPEAIDFNEIFNEIIAFENKKGLPPRFEISYEIEPSITLRSDVRLVYLVLENLIDNAIKFCNTSGRINPYVKISVSKAGAFVKVEIEDNAIGIFEQGKLDIFQMFMRGSERSETGGIGLYLARHATEKMGGEVSLEYSSRDGSKFQVLFPQDLTIVLEAQQREEKKLLTLLEEQIDEDVNSQATVI